MNLPELFHLVNEEAKKRNRKFILYFQDQETPVRFIVQDLYDEVENPADILNMPFAENAKAYYREYTEGMYGGN